MPCLMQVSGDRFAPPTRGSGETGSATTAGEPRTAKGATGLAQFLQRWQLGHTDSPQYLLYSEPLRNPEACGAPCLSSVRTSPLVEGDKAEQAETLDWMKLSGLPGIGERPADLCSRNESREVRVSLGGVVEESADLGISIVGWHPWNESRMEEGAEAR